MPRLAAVFGLLLALSACGHLEVQIDVLNPSVIDAELDRATVRGSLALALKETQIDVEKNFGQLKEVHRKVYARIADSYREKIKSGKLNSQQETVVNQSIDDLTTGFDTLVGSPYYATAITEVATLDAELRRAYMASPNGGAPLTADQDPAVTVLLRKRNAVLYDFRAKVIRDIAVQLTDAEKTTMSGVLGLPGLAPAEVAAIKQTVAKEVNNSIIKGQGIVDTPYAYAVAGAPDALWAPRFNEAWGKGYFGNINLAIKLESLGNFTIKGVTFDPSDVARVAAKVTTQALLVATQIAGVPVSTTATPSTDGAALATASKSLGDADAKNAMRQSRLRDRDAALLDIAAAVLREDTNLAKDGSDAPVRLRAAASLKATYDAHKARLDLSDLAN
jgi:hypothetical protein